MKKYFTPFQFIKSPFQINFIIRYCLIVIASSMLAGGYLLFWSRNAASITVLNAKIESIPMLHSLYPWALKIIGISLLSSFLLAVFVFLIISYQIGIPLLQVKQNLEHLARIGTVDDIADTVLYLATSGFVTGQTITVDGGMTHKMIWLE